MPGLVTFLMLAAVAIVVALVILAIRARRLMAEAERATPQRKPSSNSDDLLAQTILNAELQTPAQADMGGPDDRPIHHDTPTSVDHQTHHHDVGGLGHHDVGSFDSGAGGGHSH